ncbi:MAG: hypothetical protein HKN23_12950 [Verrucomicrobiales bacterium]|nr:hypothetical protein [Verrucomicrobiales bacterium]
MKKLIVVANDLEGSGKSTLARALNKHLTDQEIRTLLVTSDERDVDESFPGDYWDFDDELELSQLIHALDRHDAVILDVQSGMARVWADFCAEEELDTLLGEMDVEMSVVIPVNSSERSNEEMADIADLFADQADYVVAHMPMEPQRSKEIQWKGSEAAKAVKYLGAFEINVPQIETDLETALGSAELTLPQALDRLTEVPRFLEVEACQWLEQVSGEVHTADDYLVPEEVGTLVAAY